MVVKRWLGEPLRAVEALGTEAQRITRFRWHASGQMSHLILENPATGEQVTEWVFGTTLATSGVARNDLVSGKIWPTGESESLLYNRQGGLTQRTDPNGSVRQFTYDQLGQLLDDAATTVATGVDATMRRVSIAYNDRSLREVISTHDAPSGGGVINQVKLEYDAFGLMIADHQEHDGAVDGSTPSVTYGYTDGSGNVLRRTSVTAPGGKQVDFAYGTSGDALADITYGYDRASRRTWRKDLTPASDDEFDRSYGYDALGQVKTANRGTLNNNQTAIGGIPQEAEAWNYDEQGNWLTYDKAEDGTEVIDQSRRSNQSNQIVAIDGTNDGVAYDKNGNMVRIPTGDALTGAPRKLVWNAWDQLVEVRVESSNALIQTNAYDGLFRRTTRTLADSTVIHQYYNDQWKPVEERKDASTDPLAVYYWGARPGHRDELIRRDRDTDGNGTLDETLWCLMDYFDPMAILNSSGAVQERYAYSVFGVPLILAPDYAVRSTSSFAWEFLFHGQFTDAETGYQNYGFRFYVPELGNWPSRDPILGIEFRTRSLRIAKMLVSAHQPADTNLYGALKNAGVNIVDFLGLACGITVRRYVGGAAHQWINDSASGENTGFYPSGTRPNNEGEWRDENEVSDMNPGRPNPDDPNAYYEWETKKKKFGKMPNDTKCCDASCDEIVACVGDSTENCAQNPTFNGLTGNCRHRSEQAIENCCLKKGKQTHRPPGGRGPVGRAVQDVGGGSDWVTGG